MYVYLIQAGETDLYKVGKSSDPDRRIQGLQTGNGEPLRLIGVIPCPTEDAAHIIETLFADALGEHNTVGEWYRLTDDVLGHVLWFFWRQPQPQMTRPMRWKESTREQYRVALQWLREHPDDLEADPLRLERGRRPQGELVYASAWGEAQREILGNGVPDDSGRIP